MIRRKEATLYLKKSNARRAWLPTVPVQVTLKQPVLRIGIRRVLRGYSTFEDWWHFTAVSHFPGKCEFYFWGHVTVTLECTVRPAGLGGTPYHDRAKTASLNKNNPKSGVPATPYTPARGGEGPSLNRYRWRQTGRQTENNNRSFPLHFSQICSLQY